MKIHFTKIHGPRKNAETVSSQVSNVQESNVGEAGSLEPANDQASGSKTNDDAQSVVTLVQPVQTQLNKEIEDVTQFLNDGNKKIRTRDNGDDDVLLQFPVDKVIVLHKNFKK